MVKSCLRILILTTVISGLYTCSVFATSYAVQRETIGFEGVKNIELNIPSTSAARERRGTVHEGYYYVFLGTDFVRINLEGAEILSPPSNIPLANTLYEGTLVGYSDRIYVLGRSGSSTRSADEVYEYNISTDSWRQLNKPPIELVGSAAVTVGDCIFVFGGGRYYNTVSSTVYKYYPLTDTWVKSSAALTVRGADLVQVEDEIYILSAMHSAYGSNMLRRFDPVTETFTVLANAPKDFHSNNAITLENGIWSNNYYYAIAENKWHYVGDSNNLPLSYNSCSCRLRFSLEGRAFTVGNTPGLDTLSLTEVILVKDKYTYGTWKRGKDLPYKTDYGYVQLNHYEGKIYGIASDRAMYAYTIASDTWEKKSWTALHVATCPTFLIGDKIYYISRNYTTSVRKLIIYKYDINADTFTEEVVFDEDVLNSALQVVGDKIYIMGSETETGFTNNVFIYDTITKELNTGPSMLHARGRAGSVLVDNYLYVVGGYSPEYPNGGIERLDLQRGVWENVIDFNFPYPYRTVQDPVVVYHNNRIIMATYTGLRGALTLGATHTEPLEFNLDTRVLTTLPTTTRERREGRLFQIDDMLFFVGGHAYQSHEGKGVYEYNREVEVRDSSNLKKALIGNNRLLNTQVSALGAVEVEGSIYMAGVSSTTFEIFDSGVVSDFQVTFNPMGGVDLSQSEITVSKDTPYGSLPTVSKKGFDMTGWFTAPTGGFQVTSLTVPAENKPHTLYARWEPKTNIKVSYNVNGGDYIEFLQKFVTFDSLYGVFPNVAKYGYYLLGWL